MAQIHYRMPVVLDEADWPKWLGEEPATADELYALLKPCPDDVLKSWPVDGLGKELEVIDLFNRPIRPFNLDSPTLTLTKHSSVQQIAPAQRN
jgi:hypothetical protein